MRVEGHTPETEGQLVLDLEAHFARQNGNHTERVRTFVKIGQRHNLQVLQNNALRLCMRYRLLDRVQIDRLHFECKIIELEQRRRKQLLRLMYINSQNIDNIKIHVRITRTAEKLVFKKATKCTGKFINSPFYKGTLLWDKLDRDVQYVNTLERFMKELKKLYIVYQEIW